MSKNILIISKNGTFYEYPPGTKSTGDISVKDAITGYNSFVNTKTGENIDLPWDFLDKLDGVGGYTLDLTDVVTTFNSLCNSPDYKIKKVVVDYADASTLELTGIIVHEDPEDPVNKEQFVNSPIDLSGLKVIGEYLDRNNKFEFEHIIENYTTNVKEIDTSTAGEKEITISYKNYTASLTINLVEPELA